VGDGVHSYSEMMEQEYIDGIRNLDNKAANKGLDTSARALRERSERLRHWRVRESFGSGKASREISFRAVSGLENIEGDRNSTSDC
jgi:hypothetical protein